MSGTFLAGLMVLLLLVLSLCLALFLSSSQRKVRKSAERFGVTHSSSDDRQRYSWTEEGLQVSLHVPKNGYPYYTVRASSGLPAVSLIPSASLEAGTAGIPDLREIPRPPKSSYRFFTSEPEYLEHLLAYGLSQKLSTSLSLRVDLTPDGTLTVRPTRKTAIMDEDDLREALRFTVAVGTVFSGRPRG